jgi:hypothetical protein
MAGITIAAVSPPVINGFTGIVASGVSATGSLPASHLGYEHARRHSTPPRRQNPKTYPATAVKGSVRLVRC